MFSVLLRQIAANDSIYHDEIQGPVNNQEEESFVSAGGESDTALVKEKEDPSEVLKEVNADAEKEEPLESKNFKVSGEPNIPR